MTLLDLPHNQSATIISMSVESPYEERLHALGICVGNTLLKLHDSASGPDQPVCVQAHGRSVFAISRTLAAHIQMRIG